MVDLVFAGAFEGVQENNVPLLQLAADVFEELISSPRTEDALRE